MLLAAGLNAVLADYPSGPSPSIGGGKGKGKGKGGGGGGGYGPQVQYAGPIVYSDEKPPIIHFPPPPEVWMDILGYGDEG